MLQVTLIILVLFIAAAIDGWFGGMPVVRGRQPTLRFKPMPKNFSLRTLLIATALVAVVLGVYSFLNRPVVELPPLDVGDFGQEIVR